MTTEEVKNIIVEVIGRFGAVKLSNLMSHHNIIEVNSRFQVEEGRITEIEYSVKNIFESIYLPNSTTIRIKQNPSIH